MAKVIKQREGVKFQSGELWIHHHEEHYRIRAWPRPEAWHSKDGTSWERCWPEFRFINFPVRKKKPVKAIKGGLQLELGLDLPPTWAPQTKTEAFDQLRQTIPVPFAFALAPFQSQQWNPLVFLHFNSDFLDLLKSSPVLAYLLANHPPISYRIYREARTFLPNLIKAKQVDMLDYIDLGCRKQMLGIIKKVRLCSVSDNVISCLQDARHNPEVMKMLSHLESINTGVLAFASNGRLLKLLPPMFFDEVSRDQRNHYTRAAYRNFSDCLRMHGELFPRRKFPKITSLAKLAEVFEELSLETAQREFRKKNPVSPLPPPPIPSNESIQALTSIEDLIAEGVDQCNCVAGYARMVASGDCYIYRVLSPERATLSIMQHRGYWRIGELRATCNGRIFPQTEAAVEAWLEEHQLGVIR